MTKTPRQEKAGEPRARALVHTILGVPVCRNDTGAQNNQVDAVIHPAGRALDDGFPLEVVRVTNPDRRAQQSALEKSAGEISIRGLRRGYTVMLFDPTLSLGKPRWLQNRLRAYEQWELNPSSRPQVSLITTRFHIFTNQLPGMEPGDVWAVTAAAHSAPMSPPQGMYAAMLEELFAPGGAVGGDVVAKLDRHGGQQRHAFIWGEAPEHEGFGLLRRVQPGDLDHEPEPDLPTGLTHVWLALSGHEGAAVVLWVRRHGWQVHHLDEIRTDDAFACAIHAPDD